MMLVGQVLSRLWGRRSGDGWVRGWVARGGREETQKGVVEVARRLIKARVMGSKPVNKLDRVFVCEQFSRRGGGWAGGDI